MFTDGGEVQVAGLVETGVPGEDTGRKSNAASVALSAFVIKVPEDGWGPITGRNYTVTQDSARVPGSVESGDGFGSSVLSGEFGQDDGRQRLVVGTPGENLGSIVDGGMVSSTGEDGRPNGGPQPGAWSQDSPGVSGEDRGSVADAGMAYLGVAPGAGRSVALLPPDPQSGGGLGMVPMRVSADLTANPSHGDSTVPRQSAHGALAASLSSRAPHHGQESFVPASEAAIGLAVFTSCTFAIQCYYLVVVSNTE